MKRVAAICEVSLDFQDNSNIRQFFCLFMLSTLYPFALSAQTAHAGATIPIGSGFSGPSGVAVDRSGNVFVADYGNDAVKEILAVNGVVSSSSQVIQIGGGFSYPYGAAVDGSGNVFVADTGNNAVKEIVAVNGVVSSGSQVIQVGSGFNYPLAVAVDSNGNVFVCETNHNAVKEILAVNGVFSSGSAVNTIGSGFYNPIGVAVDGSGNVFVADNGNDAVKEILAVNGVVSSSSQVIQVGSGFLMPYGVAVDGSGNVFVADISAMKEIVAVNGVVSSSSQVIPIVGGGGEGAAVDGSGNVFFANSARSVVNEILSGLQKFPTTPVGSTSAPLTVYFTFDSAGTLASTPYLVLTQGAQNLDFRAGGAPPANACAGGQSYNAGDVCAVSVTFTPAKPYLRIGAVQLMGSGGTPIATFNLRGTGTGPQVIFPGNSNAVSLPVGSGFNQAIGAAVDGSGNVFVADGGNHAVKQIVAVNGVVSSTSAVITVGSGFSAPAGTAVDGSGNVFVADTAGNAVYEIVAVNGVVSPGSSVNTLASGLNFPSGLAVDASGNVFVADTFNKAVKEIVAVNGVVSVSSPVIAVGSGFNDPLAVAVDGSGNVFVADPANSAVKEIVAVNGVVSSASSVITLASVNFPSGLAVDASGNVFAASFSNSAAAEINRSTPPSFTFASTPVGSPGSDSPQSLQIQNSGNTPLTAIPPGLAIGSGFIQVPGSGTPADCTATFSLTPGQACNLSINFIPLSIGPINSAATFTDNALNTSSSQIVRLSGTGLAVPPAITFSTAASYAYGQSFVAAAVSNSAGAITYSLVGGPASVTPAGSVTVTGEGLVSIQASQAAAGAYLSGTKQASFNAVQATSSTGFTAALVKSGYGSAASLKAVVSPQFSGTPTGSVKFYDGATLLTTATLSGGTASYTTPQLAGAAHSFSAAYSGDTNFIRSASNPVSLTVPVTAVSLQLAATQLVYPLPPAFEIQVSPASGKPEPTGTVTIYDGATQVASLPLFALTRGILVGLVLPPLNVGTHPLQADYSGDANYPPGQSVVVPVTVTPGPVTLSLNCANTRLNAGQTLSCTVDADEAVLPVTGTVNYTITGVGSGSAGLNNAGQATITAKPGPGSGTITVTYAAQGNYQAAAAASVNFTVK